MSNAFTAMDATLTGADYTWDYSQLAMTSQTVDTFLSISSTPFPLNLFFLASSNQATYSATSNLNAIGIPVNGTYNFFNNSSGTFSQRGIGLVLSAGAAPISFSSPDVVYKFPLHYNNLDSSTSGYTISNIPGLTGIFYGVTKTRINKVDGWGTLTTPYGTFPVLRMQSVIHEHDSIVLDTLLPGFGINLPEQIEYKWLGAGEKIPLLQINTTLGLPTSIVYRDSLRSLINVPEISSPTFNFEVFPNPASSQIAVTYSLKQSSDIRFEIISTDGKVIFSENYLKQPTGEHIQVIQPKQSLSSGNYFLRMTIDGKTTSKKLIVTK
jgi:hypothetical protein